LQSDQQIFLFGLPDDEVGTQNAKLALNKKIPLPIRTVEARVRSVDTIAAINENLIQCV